MYVSFVSVCYSGLNVFFSTTSLQLLYLLLTFLLFGHCNNYFPYYFHHNLSILYVLSISTCFFIFLSWNTVVGLYASPFLVIETVPNFFFLCIFSLEADNSHLHPPKHISHFFITYSMHEERPNHFYSATTVKAYLICRWHPILLVCKSQILTNYFHGLQRTVFEPLTEFTF